MSASLSAGYVACKLPISGGCWPSLTYWSRYATEIELDLHTTITIAPHMAVFLHRRHEKARESIDDHESKTSRETLDIDTTILLKLTFLWVGNLIVLKYHPWIYA